MEIISIFSIIPLLLGFIGHINCCDKKCDAQNVGNCEESPKSHMEVAAAAERWAPYLRNVELALAAFKPCGESKNTSCYRNVLKRDLAPFKDGISKELIEAAAQKGTLYQIIDGKIYRAKECMFPARCSGVEHFLLQIASTLPDMEFVINTRDWPQVSKHFPPKLPVFSFSKTGDYEDIMYPAWLFWSFKALITLFLIIQTGDYVDIMYPAWSFWEGGPAIKLYPSGMGRWGEHRISLAKAALRWPWSEKEARGFFRGSRTSSERDPLILLSRERADLVDAQYTKNQAWKSDKDTLNAPPAEEVRVEDHCKFRYLFNFRGVAASFRFKHLFLCGSLVLHVGDQWQEFFYSELKPWVHYLPLPVAASQGEIRELLEFARDNDDVVHEIANRGQLFIKDHLRLKDVQTYWLQLLRRYSKLLQYKVEKNPSFLAIASQQ